MSENPQNQFCTKTKNKEAGMNVHLAKQIDIPRLLERTTLHYATASVLTCRIAITTLEHTPTIY